MLICIGICLTMRFNKLEIQVRILDEAFQCHCSFALNLPVDEHYFRLNNQYLLATKTRISL